jgi:ribose transport system substrate-binding protein
VIEQNPEKMGEMSVNLLVNWLNGESEPLDMQGYFTDINILKAKSVNE